MKVRSALGKAAFSTVLSGIVLLFAADAVRAADIGSDNAGNYTSWTNGSNQGTGFNAWDLTNNNNNGTSLFSGYFLGDSTAGSGNINSSGTSFGIYANPGAAFANASRSFSGGALTVGETFSLSMAVNFRNGNKGISLRSSGSEAFNFNVGSDDYQVNGVSLVGNGNSTGAWAYSSTSVINFSFTQMNATQMQVSIARGADSYSNLATISGVDSFNLYNSGTDDGGSANNLYFNNLAVAVPEPSTWALLSVAGVALFAIRRTRRSAVLNA